MHFTKNNYFSFNLKMNNEYTPLLSRNDVPKYVFQSSIFKRRRQRIRQFQFCVCAIVLFSISMLLLVISTYAFRDIFNLDNNNNNSLPLENVTKILNELNVLPNIDKKRSIYTDDIEWEKALNVGEDALKQRDEIEERMRPLDNDHPSYKHQKLLATSMKIRNITRIGFKEQRASEYLKRSSEYLKRRDKNATHICNRYNITYKEYCKENFVLCNPNESYRTFDGTCNNLKNPKNFGVAFKPFRRILTPDYADGWGKPRASKDGIELPSARNVSLTVHRPFYKDDPKFTVMLAVFGQFLDHDISATASSSMKDGSPVSCCSQESINYPECFPVHLDISDPYYVKHNISCLEFVRSAAAPVCCLGPREQLNTVSAYIDGSMIYGRDLQSSKNLRSFTNGTLLIYLTEDNRTLLPVSKNLNDGCNREDEADNGRYCFATGDSRANENIHLTSMHLLWLRHHNNVAGKLAKINGHWNDEKIFQETRKILIGQIQHITFNEFLINLLGRRIMENHELLPKDRGYFHKYNDSMDASISNVFATAAFRFAHSLIPNLIKMLKNDKSNVEYVEMHKMLLDPFKLYNRYGIDETIIGALNTHIQANDPYFAPEIKQHLFRTVIKQQQQQQQQHQQNNSRTCGLDLVTLNIQRGRDHGLPGYTIWRERCGLFRPRTIKQLAGVIDDESLKHINNIYRHPDDIDLYTGALSEKPLQDGIIGPTLTCIIQDQFVRLKKGDRYWYENSYKPYAFTIYQLNEIRKTLLASIICENSDDVRLIQRYVMKSINNNNIKNNNKLVNCSDIPQLNISYWYDDSYKKLSLNNENFQIKIVN